MEYLPTTGRRRFLRTVGTAMAVVATGPMPAGWAQGARTFRPEQFGAKGDGRTDDTGAFQALGRAVSQAGGGAIVLRAGAVYRIGRQVASRGKADFSFAEQPMLLVENANGVTIQGNGATLKLNDGLRYGSFDPATGKRFDPPASGRFTPPGYAAVVGRMVEFRNCSDIRVSDLELDGNMDRLELGGRYGDVEIQLPATGLQLTQVSRVLVENVRSHSHGLDGIYLYGRNTAEQGGAIDAIVMRNVHCDRNGRQGMSVVGGRGMRFERCTFSNTGQGPFGSRPKAGVDIEPNGGDWTSDATFLSCEFINNRGVGLLADTGNSHTLFVSDCTFWQGFAPRPGVTPGSGDALWLGRKGVRVERCRVHGNITHMPASAQIARTSFDDAAHPRYGRSAQRRPYLLINAGGTFDHCSFSVTGDGQLGLILAKPAMTLRDCRLHFAGSGTPISHWVAAFSNQTVLQDVFFSEAVLGPDRHLFIKDNDAQLRGKVIVQGPRIRWHAANGPTGNVGPAR